MGQKVHPTGIRLGIVKSHKSTWFANTKDYPKILESDYLVRKYLNEKLSTAGISSINIERPAKNAKISIKASRPGIIIGKKGADIEHLRSKLSGLMGVPVQVEIEEIKKPDLDATLVAQSIAQQLERRVMFRRAMKRSVTSAMRLGAKGIKICVSGRLGGAEIARKEWSKEGRVPLHTFRADIDYGFAEANTTYGIIGVKVWIFKGEIIGGMAPEADTDNKSSKPTKSTKSAKPSSGSAKTNKQANKPAKASKQSKQDVNQDRG